MPESGTSGSERGRDGQPPGLLDFKCPRWSYLSNTLLQTFFCHPYAVYMRLNTLPILISSSARLIGIQGIGDDL
jgi:hypothetical protein